MVFFRDLPPRPDGRVYSLRAEYVGMVRDHARVLALFRDSTAPPGPLELQNVYSSVLAQNGSQGAQGAPSGPLLAVEVWPEDCQTLCAQDQPTMSDLGHWYAFDARSTHYGFIAQSSFTRLDERAVRDLRQHLDNWKVPARDTLAKLAAIQYDPPLNLDQCYFATVRVVEVLSTCKSYVYEHVTSANLGIKDLDLVVADPANPDSRLAITIGEGILSFLGVEDGGGHVTTARDLDLAVVKAIGALANNDTVYNIVLALDSPSLGVYKWTYKTHTCTTSSPVP